MNKNRDRSFSVLTHQVLWYQASGEGYEEIKEKIILTAYTYPRKYFWGYRENASEFCITFIPRIHRIVTRFRYTGNAFECYLERSIYLQIQTFLRSLYEDSHRMNVLYHQQAMYEEKHAEWAAVSESPPELPPLHRNIPKQRLIILVLVQAFSITSEYYEQISMRTGYSVKRVNELLQHAQNCESKRFRRYTFLQQMRDRYFSEILKVQYRILHCCDPAEQASLRLRQEKLQAKLDRTRQRLEDFPLHVPHRVVAEILGISKGTVDSSMFYLKKDYPFLHRPMQENTV